MTAVFGCFRGGNAPCEILLTADWVFHRHSIAHKTFPRSLDLSRNAKLMLRPIVQWLEEFRAMGIDDLAGMVVTDPIALKQAIAEGVRIFETGVQYRVLAFSVGIENRIDPKENLYIEKV